MKTTHEKILEIFKGDQQLIKSYEEMRNLCRENRRDQFDEYMLVVYEAGKQGVPLTPFLLRGMEFLKDQEPVKS